ncbi:MAG TPA: 3'-5' exonuclease [Solirubrobacteraceae bacterium]
MIPRRRGGAAASYARARLPPPHTPWRDARYCVVDLELSGLDPRHGEVISYAALAIDEGRIVLASAVAGLVHPTRPLAEESIRIHGIRAADLAQAPELSEAIKPLLAAMTGRILIAHHAPVERAFLRRALRSAGARLRRPVLDTAVLARLWLAERDGALPAQAELGELARACGLPVHAPHTAAGDALTTAQLFLACASALDALRPETVRSLARARGRLVNVETYWR